MYPWIPLFIRTLGYLPDSSDVISEVPEYSEIQFWGGDPPWATLRELTSLSQTS